MGTHSASDGTAVRRLTEFSHGAGCACKLAPAALDGVLARLAPNADPDLLVDASTGDDAAVYRIAADRALVLTTDFFTPIVDDARTWGCIAAVNAVSDVYAMGGRPLLALNLVAWNTDELPMELLGAVLEGAASVAAEAGFLIVGGHSVDDPEPKFGLAVVGEVHPDELLTNAGLRPGQHLVLSKAIGTGLITTAIKRGALSGSDEVVQSAVASMSRLNATAAEVARAHGATGATDITGFGLLGHLARMAQESRVEVVLASGAVPVLPGARALLDAGHSPGGARRNLAWVADRVESVGANDDSLALLADPQTSGGLVFGVDPDRSDAALDALLATGHAAAVIGHAREGGDTGVVVHVD